MSDKTEKIQKLWEKYLNSESYTYNPDDKIITRHGCICKKKWMPTTGTSYKGVTVKNACVKDKGDGKFWCEVSSVPGDKRENGWASNNNTIPRCRIVSRIRQASERKARNVRHHKKPWNVDCHG